MNNFASLLPHVNAFTAAIRAGDSAAVCACADWLQDQDGLDLPAVLTLFRGTPGPLDDPASFADGLHEAALAKWLEGMEPGKKTSLARWIEGAMSVPVKATGGTDVPRWQAVNAVSLEQYWVILPAGAQPLAGIESIAADAMRGKVTPAAFLSPRIQGYCQRVWNGLPMMGDHDYVFEAEKPLADAVYAAVARARRWLKRRILALFPEVTAEVEAKISQADVQDDLPALWDWLRDKKWTYDNSVWVVFLQTLAAPDWIPPEPPTERQAGAFPMTTTEYAIAPGITLDIPLDRRPLVAISLTAQGAPLVIRTDPPANHLGEGIHLAANDTLMWGGDPNATLAFERIQVTNRTGQAATLVMQRVFAAPRGETAMRRTYREMMGAEKCPYCQGTGGGAPSPRCFRCNGTGRVPVDFYH